MRLGDYWINLTSVLSLHRNTLTHVRLSIGIANINKYKRAGANLATNTIVFLDEVRSIIFSKSK